MSEIKKIPRKTKKLLQREKQLRDQRDEINAAQRIPAATDSHHPVPEAEPETVAPPSAHQDHAVISPPILASPDKQRSLWPNLLVALFICGLAFLIYANTLTVPFVFDDRTNISHNPPIRVSRLSVANLATAAFDSPVPSRPLANITLALNYYFHGYALPGYHIVNIAIHAITGILLYFLFIATFRTPVLQATLSRPRATAFAAAVIWLAHPLQTQSVTYLIQRMNSLATMFYLLALLLYATARFSTNRLHRLLLFTGCALSGLAGFWSKEILITLPFFILLYEFYFFQDLDRKWLKSRFFVITATTITLAIIFLAGHKLAVIASGTGFDQRPFTMGQRLLTESRVVIFYLSQLFFPVTSRLNLFHSFPLSLSLLQPLTTLFSCAALASLLGLSLWLAREQRLLSFCILWYLGNLVLESSIIPLEIIFEHRNYLPSTFLSLLFSYLLFRVLSCTGVKALAPIIMCLLAITFSSLTYERNKDWRDEKTLLLDCLAKAPDIARSQASLGYVLMWEQQLDEAMRRFQIALRLKPTPTDRVRILENMAFIQKMKKYPGGHRK